jgi:DNA mismatch repair ATPase MutS
VWKRAQRVNSRFPEESVSNPSHEYSVRFVESGKMRFDYRLRDGVVAKSNAIELMRLIGLQV